MSAILEKLRDVEKTSPIARPEHETGSRARDEFIASGAAFAASHPDIENIYAKAAGDLMNCVVPSPPGDPMLIEGAQFIGCWLESTASINAELLSRFCPRTAQSTMRLFAKLRRADGLLPYKVTADGPSYRQIQMVTPFARSVWTNYCDTGDREFLREMYDAIAANDKWLAEWRDTRKTGCVEAFCTFDTGHDASPRFWHVPDTTYMQDPACYAPDNPLLPFLAPDLTANVYCQRKYLQLMADTLGIRDKNWPELAGKTRESLMTHCYDPEDGYFYDRDNLDRFVRIQTDNLIRVAACEVCDDAMFADFLRKYLLNTRKFFCRYPITTIALDDPRFSQMYTHNSWAGQVSFLTQIRLPRAFEYHRRYVELTWILHPILTALARFKKFTGSINAWMGCEGYGENYTPTMLCVLDYIERMCGILPTPDRELWFTALIPYGMEQVVAEETGYSRRIDGRLFEFVNERGGSRIFLDGEQLYAFPLGIRVVTDRRGTLTSVIGMQARPVSGEILYRDSALPFCVSGNERLELRDGKLVSVDNPGVIPPNYGQV